ncbi:MAG: acetate/propionate family kinase [Bauldia litoralis]
MAADEAILVINSGSSSIKFALFGPASAEPVRRWSGSLERIGFDDGRFVVRAADGTALIDETGAIPGHAAALDLLLDWIGNSGTDMALIAVGHRVVHGGEACDCPHFVTPALEARLTRLVPLAPLHQPHNLRGITAIGRRRPDLPQVACFDTAFHNDLPRVARLTGLPRRFEEDGIRRYGFHGLSYEYVVGNLRRQEGDGAANERIIAAHLGNGASMAAIRNGRSVETSMGFSTLAGLPMGTRPGDLDPGIVLHLLLERKMTPDEVQQMLYRESGLLGLSGLSRNMADLLARRDVPEAAEAIGFFCHHARRHLAGLAAALGGVDRVIFTGGIGANSAEIRARTCDGLGFLGLALDAERNAAHERVVSSDGSAVLIQAFQTDEELVIARHTRDLLGAQSVTGRAQAHG